MRLSNFRFGLLGMLATVLVSQGCWCWGWGWCHYHNCCVYLGAPPGAKTYGNCCGWPYAPGWPAPALPGRYSAYWLTNYAAAGTAEVYETAPMPRLHGDSGKPTEGVGPDLLLPPPRKGPSQPEHTPPEPSKGQPLGSKSPAHERPLQLEVQGPQQVHNAEQCELRVILTNHTDASFQDVEVILHLPKPVRVETLQPTGQVRGQEVVWKLANLGPRIREVFSVQVRAQNTANSAVCHATALAADGTGAAASWALRIVPAQ